MRFNSYMKCNSYWKCYDGYFISIGNAKIDILYPYEMSKSIFYSHMKCQNEI